jgi:hypothetical protein
VGSRRPVGGGEGMLDLLILCLGWLLLLSEVVDVGNSRRNDVHGSAGRGSESGP